MVVVLLHTHLLVDDAVRPDLCAQGPKAVLAPSAVVVHDRQQFRKVLVVQTETFLQKWADMPRYRDSKHI
jgi:hypothetical protein